MENVWACEPEYLKNYLETVINAKLDAEKIDAVADLGSQTRNRLLEINGSVARISIQGVLSRQGPSLIDLLFGFNGTSYPEIIDAINAVSADESITKVILAMDTPGGEAQGVEDVAQSVAQLASKKEVVAENNGLLASAGYWIASQATRVEAVSQIALTGSIGVVVVGIDTTGFEEQTGLKRVKIVSRNAPNKQADVDTEEGISVLQELVDSIERVFISQVANGRQVTEKKVIEDFGKGGLLIARDPDNSKPDAFTAGLIDHVQMETTNIPKFEGGEKQAAEEAVVNIDVIDSELENEDQKPKTKKENPRMSDLIKELCAEHSGLEALIAEIKSSAFDAGAASVDARVKKAVPIVESSAYPKAIKALACKVLNGESEAAALEGAVAVFDAQQEQDVEDAAIEATDEVGETPAQQPIPVAEDGSVASEADYQAAIESKKGGI